MRTLLPARRSQTGASFSERAVERITHAVGPSRASRRRSLSERTVERITRAVAPSTIDRRGFLYRAAITGTALAVNPFDFAFKPGTAYASVCGDGSSCSSGWTAFCCTINNGANMCPPGSYVAGWWRIDDSAFCRGSARYIIDCNRRPGSSCNCRCASGSCDQRRVCCNNFRYGQCNQQIAGVTEVVCRVVTCTAPWQWDPSCTRTVRVDNRTRTHSAPCLPGTNPSHIEIKYQDMGMSGAVVGRPTSAERAGANGGRVRQYSSGYITYRAGVGAWSVYGGPASVYAAEGLEAGLLGYAISDRENVSDGRGRQHRFEDGVILMSLSTPTVAVSRPYWAVYRALGGPRGVLGYPTEARRPNPHRGVRQRFENGAIHSAPGIAPQAVYGRFDQIHELFGGTDGHLGFPTRHQREAAGGRGHVQRFELGAIYSSSDTPARAVIGPIFQRYRQIDTTIGLLRYPTAHQVPVGDGRGTIQHFEQGVILSTPSTGAWEVIGPWYSRYTGVGGPTGPLGYPISKLRSIGDGGRWQRFEDGAIYLVPGNGRKVLWGPISLHYIREEGGPTGTLGYPISNLVESGDEEVVRFQRGRIIHTVSSGDIRVERH